MSVSLQMPAHFRELFIHSGYRSPRSSPRQCITSVFEATNETLNFWTHFLPALYFWWRTIVLWPDLMSQGEFAYPMMTYMVCICIFPIMSAIAHIFNTMSDRARHICFFMDYVGLGLYVLGSAIAYRAYVFPPALMDTTYAHVYLYVAAAFGVASLVSACETRFMAHGFYKKALRMVSFGIPYHFVSIPIMHRIILCSAEECGWFALLYHKRQFVFGFLAAFLYGTHMPERLFPGRFDIIGHSHQLFHVCSVMGTTDQMAALLKDMLDRKAYILTTDTLPSASTSITLMCLVSMLNILVLSCFILKLYRVKSTKGSDKKGFCCGLLEQGNNNETKLSHRKKCM